jgi:hypothetical protein
MTPATDWGDGDEHELDFEHAWAAQSQYEKRNARSGLAVGVLALGFLLQYFAVVV